MTVKDERKRQGRVLDCCDVSELAMVFDRVLLSGREAKSRTSQLIERELIHRDSLVFVHNWDEERDGSVLDHYELLLETPPIVTHRQGVTTGIAVLRPRADIGASLGEGRPS